MEMGKDGRCRVQMHRLAAIVTGFLLISTCTGSRISLRSSVSDGKIITGDDANVMCEVDDIGNADLGNRLIWKKVVDGNDAEIVPTGRVRTQEIPGRPSVLLLSLYDVEEEDAGIYNCSFGSDTAAISISVFRKITFLDTPTEQHPLDGQDAKITCRNDAKEATTYITWSKGYTSLAAENGSRYSVSEGDLTIKAFNKTEDDGVYECRVVQQETGRPFKISINVTGYIPPGPVDVELLEADKWPKGVHEDTSVRLSCTAPGVPPPDLKWLRNGAEISPSSHYNVSERGVLEIINVTDADAGAYRCDGTNAVGKDGKDLFLDVYLKPRIEELSTENRTAKFGDDFSETCRYDGGETLNAEWTFMEEPITVVSDGQDVENQNDPYVVIVNKWAELHIPSVQLEDAGEFKCVVSNDAGAVSRSFVLQVQKPPEITSYTQGKVRAVLRDQYNVTMFCEASGQPSPTVAWSKKGAGTIASEEGHYEVTQEESNSSLTVTVVSDNDFGTYACEANNGVEPTATAELELIKIEIPDAPVVSCDEDASSPTRITLKSETFSASQVENKQPAAIYIGVAPDETEIFILNYSFSLAPDGVYKVGKLQPEQRYLFNVSGQNEAGFSAVTTVECSTTEPRAPGKPSIVPESATNCDEHQCSLEWTVEENGGREITSYEIEYYPMPKEGDPEPTPIKLSTTDSRVAFTDLKADTSYHVGVRAVNSEGPGEMETITLAVPAPDDQHQAGDHGAADRPSSGPSTGAIIGIVLILVLIIVLLIDVACYYINQCGLLMCICVNLCGKTPPEVKAKEVMAEEGAAKDTKFEERQEKQPLQDEQPAAAGERRDPDDSESAPMINVEKPSDQIADIRM